MDAIDGLNASIDARIKNARIDERAQIASALRRRASLPGLDIEVARAVMAVADECEKNQFNN